MIEIERKFLVAGADWQPARAVTPLCQGYLITGAGRSLRIRQKGEQYLLTFKADHAGAAARYEFEYPVPAEDGRQMLALCERPPIEKHRHLVDHGGHTWEVDVFAGANAGLVLAEVELDAADAALDLPAWVGPEVTDDPRFANAALYEHPFADWGVRYADLLAGAA
ncbi:hypothetical protein CCR85_08445 [Rhodothalassium salexigens]|uniref:Adenylate cyclase n=1 Tax=Rhodothalassium salexigens DSM 2132 TaxID=1188247 RepID=A0A4R2PFD3_RHOSA|nr:CYTH domain-containing protein [Rhodothalassium salexigens]MBB4211703.1 adenylate cyclase [Rhodothalassium salexigens DSM 2132]MBK1638986.1 hypothetical protein [Rhodothalassium salexigens DSM 2132]MBK5911517.1 hypothetical protein [Rhodothalassium salexigens]MBK5919656.1 hypothetical protein [Rhodothalassium salexigens]TCP33999.1 adenylate cyclase [Rhodothalassium salexigens DSM 2132]